MSSVTSQEIRHEFLRNKIGIAGVIILTILIVISIVAMSTIPIETFQEWNNPNNWIAYPKVAVPVWMNFFTVEKIPEHKILEFPNIHSISQGSISLTSHQFGFGFDYDDFPNDFIYEFSSEYSGSPVLKMSIIRPDGVEIQLISNSLPASDSKQSTVREYFQQMR